MIKNKTTPAALLTFSGLAVLIGCQHPKSGMEESRKAEFAKSADGIGTGSVSTTNREILPDGKTNEVTVAMENILTYTENAKSKSGSLSVLSKQDAANLATDRRTSMGGRLKTGLESYRGETQPDAISAVAGPISDTLKAYLATVTGGASAAADAILQGKASDEDVNVVLDDLKAKVSELEAIKAR